MDDYDTSECLQDVLEPDRVRLGGEPLRQQAHNEAGAYVDRAYP